MFGLSDGKPKKQDRHIKNKRGKHDNNSAKDIQALNGKV